MTLLPDGRWIASPQRVSKVEERLEPILVHAMPIICDCDVQDSFAKLGPDCEDDAYRLGLRIKRIADCFSNQFERIGEVVRNFEELLSLIDRGNDLEGRHSL